MRDSSATAPSVGIINQAFVRKFFGSANPLGQKITKMANTPLWTTITGVIEDAKFSDLRQPAPPLLYIPYSRVNQWIPPQFHGDGSLWLQVRGRQSVAGLSSDLRRLTEQRFTAGTVIAQHQLIDDTLVRERLLANVANLFGGLALLLAALGLYGIISYAVVERRREIGVRMAVGAGPISILVLMLRESALLGAAGTSGGIVAALALTPLAKAQLYGLAFNDLTTFAGSAGTLLVIIFVATLIPASRAARTEPISALRYE
jgi:ABC-type antimicrobial peptide transport system permease subunit